MSLLDIEYFTDFYAATVRTSFDKPSKSVDVIFFHTRSFGDDTGLLEEAARKFKTGDTDFIEITNNEGEKFGSKEKYQANPGKSYYKKRLEDLDIPQNKILIPGTKAFHTRQENTACIKQARHRGWTSGAILAQPHQLLRAMLGAVQAMEKEKYQIELYTLGPQHVSWLEIVSGSQGEEEKPRRDHIRDEFDRIIKYQASGELASFRQLFEYLDARERGNLILGSVKGSQRFKLF